MFFSQKIANKLIDNILWLLLDIFLLYLGVFLKS